MHDRPFPFTRAVASLGAVLTPEIISELHRHCQRLLGASDAEDALLRTWRGLAPDRLEWPRVRP
jgi:hypothetical protein